MRDPRIDPKPGDVLYRKQSRVMVSRRVEIAQGAFLRILETAGKAKHSRYTLPTLDQWRRWARSADVEVQAE